MKHWVLLKKLEICHVLNHVTQEFQSTWWGAMSIFISVLRLTKGFFWVISFISTINEIEFAFFLKGLFRFIDLTHNTPLIHTSFTYSKLSMDEICGLKFYLSCVHTSQKILLKSLHAQNVSFLLLILHFWAQIYLSMK